MEDPASGGLEVVAALLRPPRMSFPRASHPRNRLDHHRWFSLSPSASRRAAFSTNEGLLMAWLAAAN